jgi:Cu+-exporting ATPase
MIKQVFKIKGMHCTSCAFNIDGELEDTDGVKEASTNFAKAKTEVEFDPEKIDEEKIVKLIKKVGYDAVPAVE